MPKVQRTPPASPSLATAQSHSEPDLASLDEAAAALNVTSRTKRPRMDFASPISDPGQQPVVRQDLKDFKDELMMMLSSWRSEQVADMTKLTEDVAHVKNQCIEIQKSNSEIEMSITSLKAQYEDVECKIERLEIDSRETKEHIVALENQLEELRQHTRSSSIEIRNVPNKENETERDLITIVKKLGTTLDINIQEQDIRDTYRRPGKPGTPRAIVAEFASVQVKNNLLTSVRRWNRSKAGSERLNRGHIGDHGDIKPIYVDEHLPYSMRKLFFQTREFAKKNDFKFCWISQGRVLLRKDQNTKYIHIKSEKCISNILNSA